MEIRIAPHHAKEFASTEPFRPAPLSSGARAMAVPGSRNRASKAKARLAICVGQAAHPHHLHGLVRTAMQMPLPNSNSS